MKPARHVDDRECGDRNGRAEICGTALADLRIRAARILLIPLLWVDATAPPIPRVCRPEVLARAAHRAHDEDVLKGSTAALPFEIVALAATAPARSVHHE